ncbi:MAG: hypothetical protein WBV94_31130 [Blastocatellia bacterium]
MANNNAALNNNNGLNKQALRDDMKSMLAIDTDIELIESIATMPIEAVKEELQQRGLNFNEALPDRISQQISARACKSASEQNVTSELPALIQKTNHPKSDARYLLQRSLHKWVPKPLIQQTARYVFCVICTAIILLVVINTFHRSPIIAQNEKKIICVKTSNNDLLSVRARNNIIPALEAEGTFIVVEESEGANATLNLLVKQNAENKEPGTNPATKDGPIGKGAGSQTVSITVQLIKQEPKRGNNRFERNYTGPIDEITSAIVEDILMYIHNSGWR